MRVIRSIADYQTWSEGKDTACVPTMGYFHQGHLDLMRHAKALQPYSCASLFVNPLQFGPGEDFERYPRDEKRDIQLASETGIDVLFIPSASEIVGDTNTAVVPGSVANRLEGESRPGHFVGVATIVVKLLEIIRPRAAIFGLKDLQQCAVIKSVVRDLFIPVEIVTRPTVREANGLAMSSRNSYLSEDEKSRASSIFRELTKLSRAPATSFEEASTAAKRCLEDEGVVVEYLVLVDSDTFEQQDIPRPGDSLVFAGRVGRTRLIDNVQIP